ncbi:MAG: carboxylesterase/lipase family protein [Acidimicrobiales bacterium]
MSGLELVVDGGTIRGIDEAGVRVFKGVPYGDDTSGEGRFQPARPPRSWSGVRDCTGYGPSCPQMTVEQMLGVPVPPQSDGHMGTRSFEPVTGEDCLVLNVWTPTAGPSAGLPVLVWLHGGGWSTGSASWPLYDFANLARHGDVVVVGINHRVGLLGFLDLSFVGERFADSGNVGMLDVVAALEWIRDNVAGFGGDPGNVTVFGESGGGAKVATLLGMPAGRGLFHRAVAISGSMLAAQQPDHAAGNAQAVLELIGVGHDEEKLRAIDVARLIDAEIALPGREGSALVRRRGFSPVLGRSLPEHPAEAIRGGLSSDVTLLTGCNRDEALGFLLHDTELWTLSADAVLERLRPMLGDNAERVLAAYRAAQPGDSPTSTFIAASTDAMFRVPQIRLAEAKVEGGGKPTYMHLFTWGPTDPTGRIRSPHGIDMPYFFDNVDKAPMSQGPHAEPLASMMSGILSSFAHTGAPGHDGLPTWPPYTLGTRATMLLGLEPMVEHDPGGRERASWSDIRLPGLRG